MYCRKCGKQISDTAKFCNFCGTPVKKIKTTVQPKKKVKRPVIKQRFQETKSDKTSKQEQFDFIFKPKLGRFEDQLKYLSNRTSYQIGDYQILIRQTEELIDYIDDPLCKSSSYYPILLRSMNEQREVMIRILEFLTSNISTSDLNTLRKIWYSLQEKIRHLEIQLENNLEIIPLLENLVGTLEEFNEIIKHGSDVVIDRTNLLISFPNSNKQYNSFIEPLIHEFNVTIRENGILIDYEEEIHLLDQFVSFVGDDIYPYPEFTLNHLKALILRICRKFNNKKSYLQKQNIKLYEKQNQFNSERNDLIQRYIKTMDFAMTSDHTREDEYEHQISISKHLSTLPDTSMIDKFPSGEDLIPLQSLIQVDEMKELEELENKENLFSLSELSNWRD